MIFNRILSTFRHLEFDVIHTLCRSALLRLFVVNLLFDWSILRVALAEDPKAPDASTIVARKEQPLEISSSGKLDPSVIHGPLVITASNITIEGGGLTLMGATDDPKTFKGTAIAAVGVSNVTLKNVKARGWETGLKIVDGSGWTIENCDFSDNFHDPEFGWGENGRRGGIVLERVFNSNVLKNRANRVWDACVLVDSNGNTIAENDFSHTSNTCLKLWHSSDNVIAKNVLSYGLRIKPGEVRARDSACLLIESGSNNNHVVANNCTHGGDGIFVRVLNNWCSTGNLFEYNDCSFANNNGVECWAPRNTFLRNKANHCSYGFWLGGSDKTRLLENEASFNGLPDGFHNSPHLPNDGHAGIVFMFGPSSHTVVRGNTCLGNNGAGIALIGDGESQGKKWKAYHWIIEQNTLARNRWGVYARFADWINIASNDFHSDSSEPKGNDNTLADVDTDETVTRLALIRSPRAHQRNGLAIFPPTVRVIGPLSCRVGEEIEFTTGISNAAKSNLKVAWDLGDGTMSDSVEVKHAFAAVGFHRVGVTVSNGVSSELAWRDLIVVRDVDEIGTEGSADAWSIEDFHERKRSNEQISRAEFTNEMTDRLMGKSSLRVVIRPYAGFRAALTFPKTRDAQLSLEGKTKLVFWIKAINEDVTGWQGGPFIVLHDDGEKRYHIEPKEGLDLMRHVEHNEARDGWRLMEIPLQGDDRWQTDGNLPQNVRAISLVFDSWGAPTLRIWIDGLSLQ